LKNKNIIITGGLGFIGSHIVEELVETNNITIIDDLSTGKMDNLKNPDHENITLIKENLNDVKLKDVIKDDVDYIFHLAAMASVPLSVDNPIKCNDINVNSTIKLLDFAVKNNVKKIIFSSSAAIYGKNTNMPLKETEPLMPLSPYGASKATCELYLKSFYESYGLEYTALRYFNVFGPKQDENSQYAAVIPKFISSLVQNKQPIIYGDGEQTRDFIYVSNIVKANIQSCEIPYNGCLNVASGKRISINELYEIIRTELDSDLEPIYNPPRVDEIKHSLADISNLNKLNFKLNENFDEEIKTTIEWFKNEKETIDSK